MPTSDNTRLGTYLRCSTAGEHYQAFLPPPLPPSPPLDMARLQLPLAKASEALGRAGGTATDVHDLLRQKALLSANRAAELLGISLPTARAALGRLKELGIVDDTAGSGKERIYVYRSLLEILE